jgi:hypothetical protein
MPSIPNPLARLDDRQTAAVALVVGTTLVLNPLYMTAFHVDSNAYTYRTAEVSVQDGDLVFEEGPDGTAVYGPIAGIGCTGDFTGGAPLACQLDNHVAATGPITVADGYTGGARFTQVDGTFYRRVQRDVDGGVELGLERAPAETALQTAAIPRSSLTWPGRVLIWTGGVTTTYPLTNANHVVETDDGYVYLYRHRSRVMQGGGGLFGHVLRVGGILTGLLVLFAGYRRIPRR